MPIKSLPIPAVQRTVANAVWINNIQQFDFSYYVSTTVEFDDNVANHIVSGFRRIRIRFTGWIIVVFAYLSADSEDVPGFPYSEFMMQGIGVYMNAGFIDLLLFR